jgi:tRNA (guanine26-N2/guanine27-N2)-dimethyltransferase
MNASSSNDYSLIEITEGNTRLIVPKEALEESVPPKQPAFYNPAARLNRDISIIAYNSLINDVGLRERTFADALSGLGARSIRVANEVKGIEEVYINDVNPFAVSLAERAAMLNNVHAKCRFSINDACRFLIEHSSRGSRFGIIDIDPFGTPALYVDCALRAVIDEGMISMTATDTPVLNGIYPKVALRRYYSNSIKCEFSNEIGIRLMLGMLAMVASRLEMGIKPLFVQSTRHYMRVYAQVNVGARYADTMPDMLGYAHYCNTCKIRCVSNLDECKVICKNCNKEMSSAGRLWVKAIMDSSFINKMYNISNTFAGFMDKQCITILNIAKDELTDTPLYYTLDEVSRILKMRPISIQDMISMLKANGFKASRTSLAFKGFRTDASIDDILKIIKDYNYNK